MTFGTVLRVNFDSGFGVLKGDIDEEERNFDLKRDVSGEWPWPGSRVRYNPVKARNGKLRANSVEVLVSSEIPVAHAGYADKIMSATKTLAELQEGRPHEEDGVGFGSAHWKLGLVLSDMWESDASLSRMDIVRGAAYLLFRHPDQARENGVTAAIIARFLPYASKRRDSLKCVRSKASLLAGDWVRWHLFETPVCFLQLTAGGSGGRASNVISDVAAYLKIPVLSGVGGTVLHIPESHLGRFMQWAATGQGVRFRGCLDSGRKMPFDKLAERFCPKPAVTAPQKTVLRPISTSALAAIPRPVVQPEFLVRDSALAPLNIVAPEPASAPRPKRNLRYKLTSIVEAILRKFF